MSIFAVVQVLCDSTRRGRGSIHEAAVQYEHKITET